LVTDVSDDPNNFTDIDPDGDNEPDDPTKVYTPNIHIYEILTPNNDGKNDFFRILGIESFPNSTVRIYNRWGTMVYETTGYNNTDNYWDGTSIENKNKKLPVGVYYYVIDLGLKKIEKIYTGSVYLNR
jgi:gliding motility-associated-like protein